MWNGLLLLLFLSILMGAASFLAGSVPLSFSLSPRQLRFITALGVGVLVGTSLIVIIPEGVETLYSAGSARSHDGRGLAISARRTPSSLHYLPRTVGLDTVRQQEGIESLYLPTDEFPRAGTDTDQAPADPSDGSQNEEHDKDADEDFEPHAWVGMSLILGFILMYLIDTLPQTVTPSSRPQRFPISLNQFSFNRASSVDETPGSPLADTFSTTASVSSGPQSRPSSTTVGLVIHAAADGIALGASSTTADSHLSLVIFVALMIHKAPAAFGLTSVLLKQGLTKRMARAHLIVFSLAAPVGALLTWAAVHLFEPSSNALDESASTEFVTGVLLLFSGGTFLYVAMHSMQESGSDRHPLEESNLNGYAGAQLNNPYTAPPPPKPHSSTLIDTLVTVTGMLLPLLTQWGHGK